MIDPKIIAEALPICNLNKCRFYEDEVQFLDFVVLTQDIRIEEKIIEAIEN